MLHHPAAPGGRIGGTGRSLSKAQAIHGSPRNEAFCRSRALNVHLTHTRCALRAQAHDCMLPP